jgi:hypothetical protein
MRFVTLDSLLGPFADPAQTNSVQYNVALLMSGLLLAVVILGTVVRSSFAGGKSAPHYLASLLRPRVRLWGKRTVGAVLLGIALLASCNYFYGTRNSPIPVHRWDLYHTVIGAKYLDELGYVDLYKCSIAIDREGPRHFRGTNKLRDLHTLKHVDTREHLRGNDCKERFTPERLKEFRADLDEVGSWSEGNFWKKLFADKGFNGTPFNAFVAKTLLGTVELNLDNMKILAAIDPVLMGLAFLVVGWAYGLTTATLAAIFFCVFFPNRFLHMGGSLLRFDHFAAMMMAFAFLKKKHWGLAGALLGWATLERVFPVLFFGGVCLKILSDVEASRKIEVKHKRFILAFGIVILSGFLISLVGSVGGFGSWESWAEDLRVHNQRSAGFRIGFRHLFMFDGKLGDFHYGHMQSNFELRRPYYVLSVVILLSPLLLAVRRLDVLSFAALFGVTTFFLLMVATRYYYGAIVMLFLVDRRILLHRFTLLMFAYLFGTTAFNYLYFGLNPHDALMYNYIIGLQLTVFVSVMGMWLFFNPSYREQRLGVRSLAAGRTLPTQAKQEPDEPAHKDAAEEDEEGIVHEVREDHHEEPAEHLGPTLHRSSEGEEDEPQTRDEK